jgi:hypothetical protein
MFLGGVRPLSVKKVGFLSLPPSSLLSFCKFHFTDAVRTPAVTDMLIAVLNTCTTEECEEEEDVLMPETPTLLSSVSAGADAQRKAHW